MTEKRTIIDFVTGFSVPSEKFENPANQYWALEFLTTGLHYLYERVKLCEQQCSPSPKLEPGQEFSYSMFGSALPGVNVKLVTMAFHWYAVSVCQFVRTVGAIALDLGQTNLMPQEYAAEVLPDVTPFRDKIPPIFHGVPETEMTTALNVLQAFFLN